MRQFLLLGTLAPLLAFADPLAIYETFLLNPSCSSPTGYIDITVLGGTPPYTYAWSNFSTDEDATGLGPGYIEVTVTDAMSAQATQGWTLVSTQVSGGNNAQDGHASCIGQSGGEVQVIEWGTNGIPPYTYDPAPGGVDPQGDPYFYFPGVPFGTQVSINVTDAEGCTGVVYEIITGPQPIGGPFMVLQSVQGSCSAGSGGSATITNVYDGSFFSGPDVVLFDPLEQGVGYGVVSTNTITFNGLGPGHYYVKRNWDPLGYIMAWPCTEEDTIGFDIPDLGVACGTASGTVFIDNDQDCVQDGGEVGVPELVLEIEPGESYALTDASGHYSIDLVDGSYTLAQNDASLVQICPASVPVPFAMVGNAQIIDLADSSTIGLDLQPLITGGAAHPGFAFQYAVKVRNNTPQVSGDVTFTLDFDGNELSFTGASLVPASVVGDVIVWEFQPMTAYAQTTINVNFMVDVATPPGTTISANLHVVNTLPEGDVTNNVATTSTIVTGSFDPNVKSVQPADIFFLDLDDHLDYTIRFQNTGTDTAHTVVITDTLSADLDMGSFQNGASSHPCTVDFPGGRVVRWTFANILLPDSNTNEPASHGFVGFSLEPSPDSPGGEFINNVSDIFFDFNDPVRTNTASVLAEFSVGVASVVEADRPIIFPNPAHDLFTVSSRRGAIEAVELCAGDGRLLRTARPTGASVAMNTDGIAIGLYFATIRLVDGSVFSMPVMIR